MVPALLILQILATVATGQLDPIIVDPDYEILPSEEDTESLYKDFIPIQGERERKFLEGLVIEAGRHVLFPELYSQDNERASSENEPFNSQNIPTGNIKPKFYEISGQPEYEQLYNNRRTRSGPLNCPEDCIIYKPVCGSDGKVYPSECHLLKENCGLMNVTKGPWAKCRGKHYLCPSHCLDLNDPVCSSDGRIYHNICIMRKRNCGKLLQVLPMKKCYNEDLRAKDGCPERCPEIAKPTCGSNGVIYFNECFMRMQTCGMGIFQVEMAGCVYIPRCPEVCLPFHDPVCGSDGKLYINQCKLEQENCGKEVKKMPASFCVSEARGSLSYGPRPS